MQLGRGRESCSSQLVIDEMKRCGKRSSVNKSRRGERGGGDASSVTEWAIPGRSCTRSLQTVDTTALTRCLAITTVVLQRSVQVGTSSRDERESDAEPIVRETRRESKSGPVELATGSAAAGGVEAREPRRDHAVSVLQSSLAAVLECVRACECARLLRLCQPSQGGPAGRLSERFASADRFCARSPAPPRPPLLTALQSPTPSRRSTAAADCCTTALQHPAAHA